MTGLTPEYLRIPIPLLHGHTDRYQNSFFPDSVALWNLLGPDVRGAESLSILKKNIIMTYRPAKKSLFDIYEPNRIKWIFQLRVGLSPLKSHKMNHKFLEIPLMTHVNARKCRNYPPLSIGMSNFYYSQTKTSGNN